MTAFIRCILFAALCCTVTLRVTAQDLPAQLDVPPVPPHPSAAALDALGRQLFFDPSLSASHRQSCASCHDPAHAYGPAGAGAVQLGGVDGRSQGQRAVPSLRYLQNVPIFTEHYFDESVDESIDNGPTGGFTWDGRAQSAHEQARLPLLSALEMANHSQDDVVTAVKSGRLAAQFRAVFGDDIFEHPQQAFAAITQALEVFEQNPTEFYPYSSKFDAFLRHQTTLTDQEWRGLKLFNDPAKGNCALCHPSAISSEGAFPAFTDFGYVAIGAPRNGALRLNHDPNYFDLGLCGPLREDLKSRPEFCGFFRAPTLRNVTLRHTFFHNGVFHSLGQVMHFYVERDLTPAKWYGRDRRGRTLVYDDLPAAYRDNLEREPPFDRQPGQAPALNDSEIADIIVFLGTLTDGWHNPGSPTLHAAATVR